MARPRVFVSSTFYDLQHVRSDIEAFIRGFGFDAVMFEKGNVTYRQDKLREEQCYAEVSRCDIVISIVGNNFGTEAQSHAGSISHNEMRRAIDDGKQVYAFILADVELKHAVYTLNKSTGVEVNYGVDKRVLEFIDEVRAINSLGIHRFSTASDITSILKEQWAGLFHELLTTREQVLQQKMLNRIGELAEKMEETFETYSQFSRGVIGFAHPGIAHLRQLLGLRFHVFATGLRDVSALLTSLGYSPLATPKEGWLQWQGSNGEISIMKGKLFHENGGILLPPTGTWNPEHITFTPSVDDDIPF